MLKTGQINAHFPDQNPSFIVIVVLIASGLAYLLDAKDIILGDVQATIAGTEYILTPVQVALFLVALCVVIWIFLKVLSFSHP